jgi:MFS family permease
MAARQKLVLTLLLGAQFMIAVDFSILNVALPVVGEGLGFSLSRLPWIATAFALAAAGFTLLFGRVADLVGRKRLFLAGMAVLGASSLLGGLATSPEVLLVARVLQGLATAAVTPAGLALLTTAFKEGPLRERALGLNGALMSAGFTAGAILGGLLTDLLSWRWAFFVNVPVAALVLALARTAARASTYRVPRPSPADSCSSSTGSRRPARPAGAPPRPWPRSFPEPRSSSPSGSSRSGPPHPSSRSTSSSGAP